MDIFLHLDHYLAQLIATYGIWVYVILFAVVFLETGVVFTPFLPGDSLLFAAGTMAAVGSLNIGLLLALLAIAAITGDSMNYWIGHTFGKQLVRFKNGRLINQENLHKTHLFFKNHGGKSIVFARFFPIIRTFTPFVAGIARMAYGRFVTYNVVGGIVWVTLFLLAGFFFGNIPLVKNNFTMVIMGIVVVSFLPIVLKFLSRPS